MTRPTKCRRNIRIPLKDNPVLLDRAIQSLQTRLSDNLAWLNYAFGRGYKMVEYQGDDKVLYPAAYLGNGEYASLMPSDEFGNFCWFDIYDPQEVVVFTPGKSHLKISGAIVFWFNLNSIFADADANYSEEVKKEIIDVLTMPGASAGRLTIKAVYETLEKLYDGYSIMRAYNPYSYKSEGVQRLDKQYFMHPYAGIRIEFEMQINEVC